jgi:hypothetical protein
MSPVIFYFYANTIAPIAGVSAPSSCKRLQIRHIEGDAGPLFSPEQGRYSHLQASKQKKTVVFTRYSMHCTMTLGLVLALNDSDIRCFLKVFHVQASPY